MFQTEQGHAILVLLKHSSPHLFNTYLKIEKKNIKVNWVEEASH